MSRAVTLALSVALALSLGAGCAKPRLRLPTGPAQPLADAAPMLDHAFGHCESFGAISLELSLSGRAGSERLRGRLIAGLASPASIRLEAIAPFGPPVFILAASLERSVLLLPRDDRVLEGAPPRQILAALAGVDVEPDDLRAFLAGCPGASLAPDTARRHGDRWVVVDLDDGATAYLRRDPEWRPAAVVRPGLRVVFESWAGDHPGHVRLQSVPTDGPAAFDILLRLNQYERNVALPAEVFTVAVPPDADPVSLEELRRAGPMRDTTGDVARTGSEMRE